jgi:maleate isomerase
MQTVTSSNVIQVPFETDAGIGGRAAIGLLVLSSDQTIEHEFRQLIRIPGVAFYEARLRSSNDVTPEALKAVGKEITGGVDVILPGVPLDVVGFGCTSASMLLGEQIVGEEIRRSRPGIPFTTPVTGAFAGLRALGAKRVAVLTPYPDDVNEGVKSYVERQGGFDVRVMGSFKELDDRVAARITPESIMNAAETLVAKEQVDAFFISCTSLRIAECIARLEERIGVPVTSSNHALAWHCLRLAGIDDSLPQYGRLFTVRPNR